MATKNKAAEANDAVAEGFVSFDRNGIWFKSNAQFPLEDPTNAGTNKPLIRFNEGYTQATPTDWTRGQVRAGVLTMFDGHPEDEDTKALKQELFELFKS